MNALESNLLQRNIEGLGDAFTRRADRKEAARQFDLTRQDRLDTAALEREMLQKKLTSAETISTNKAQNDAQKITNRVWDDTVKMHGEWVKDGIMKPDIALKSLQGAISKIPPQAQAFLANNPNFLSVQSGQVSFTDPPPKVGSPSDVSKMFTEQQAAEASGNTELADALGSALGNKTRPTPPSGEQSNALIYSDRMQSNNQIINDLQDKGFDPSGFGAAIPRPNVMKGAEQQSYEAAKKNWITAVLRKESGAAISPAEFERAEEEYFPQFGDSPQVAQQKAQLRAQVELNMRKAAGQQMQQQPAQQQNPGSIGVGGYIPGRRYGGMTYKGGNPKDPNNWTQ